MFAAIANFSGREGIQWLLEAAREPRDAVRFFEYEKNAIDAISKCPPLNTLLSLRLSAHTPEKLSEMVLYSDTIYPVVVDDKVRGFLFFVVRVEYIRFEGLSYRLGAEAEITMRRDGTISSVKCSSYYNTKWHLFPGTHLLCLKEGDKRTEFVATREQAKVPDFLSSSGIVVSWHDVGELDLRHWKQATWLTVSDEHLALTCWARFPVRTEDEEEQEEHE